MEDIGLYTLYPVYVFSERFLFRVSMALNMADVGVFYAASTTTITDNEIASSSVGVRVA